MLFFLLLYLSLMALSSLPIWRDERLLFMRERAAGLYNTPVYFTAVVMFDLLPLRVGGGEEGEKEGGEGRERKEGNQGYKGGGREGGGGTVSDVSK